MIKQYLLAPGPTPIPNEVALAMAETMIHHRTPQFAKIFLQVRDGLKELFGTKSDVLILASSGTGAMEAAVANLLSPGEKVLIVNGGKFGERWLEISKAFGLLPIDLRDRFRAAWDEFEAQETVDSRFANALDRLQAQLQNMSSGGGSWTEHQVKRTQVLKRMEPVRTALPDVWPFVIEIIDRFSASGQIAIG